MNPEFLLGILSWGPWRLLPTTGTVHSPLSLPRKDWIDSAQQGYRRGSRAGCSDSPALYDRPALPKAVHALSSTGFSHVHRFSQGGLEREAKDGKNGLLKGSSVAFSSEGMGQPIQRMAI